MPLVFFEILGNIKKFWFSDVSGDKERPMAWNGLTIICILWEVSILVKIEDRCLSKKTLFSVISMQRALKSDPSIVSRNLYRVEVSNMKCQSQNQVNEWIK